MIVDVINQELLETEAVFYSRWHSVCIDGKAFYDLKVGGLVGPIVSAGDGNDMFVVCTYLTDLVELPLEFEDVQGYKIWDKDIATMYLENLETGIRYEGTMESFVDTEDGLNVSGSYCLFTTNLEEAYVETFFRLVELVPKGNELNKDLELVNNFISNWEGFMRDNYPERILGAI